MDDDLTAEDLYDKGKTGRGRPPEKKDPVKSEVLRLLADGEPMLSAELERKVCEVTGCAVRTVKTARDELGVKSYRSGRQWYSVLQGQSAENDSERNK